MVEITSRRLLNLENCEKAVKPSTNVTVRTVLELKAWIVNIINKLTAAPSKLNGKLITY